MIVINAPTSIDAAAEAAACVVEHLALDRAEVASVELNGLTSRFYVTLPGFSLCEGSTLIPQLDAVTLFGHTFAFIAAAIETIEATPWMRDAPISAITFPVRRDTGFHVHSNLALGFADLGAALTWAARWDEPVILDICPAEGIVAEINAADPTREQAAAASDFLRDHFGATCLRTALAAYEVDLGVHVPQGADSRLATLLRKAH